MRQSARDMRRRLRKKSFKISLEFLHSFFLILSSFRSDLFMILWFTTGNEKKKTPAAEAAPISKTKRGTAL